MNKIITVVLIILVLFGAVVYIQYENRRVQEQVERVEELPQDFSMYTDEAFGYTIAYPADSIIEAQGDNSVLIRYDSQEPVGPTRFVYLSVVPQEARESGDGTIYNYNAAQYQALVNAEVGESVSLSEGEPDLSEYFTYERLPDEPVGGKAARLFVNAKPWEFPAGTSEYRYYLEKDGTVYLIGGYFGDGDSGIRKETLDAMLTTFSFPER